jgi:hypothetical protein
MVSPDFELAVEKAMEEINAKATAYARGRITAFPIPDDKVTREAAVRILVGRATKKILLCVSDLPEPELQKLKLQIRSEFDKMCEELEGAGGYLFPSE